jgi:thioredoxin-like negative regulator of GroEL
MTGLTLSLVLQTALVATGAQPYSEAYDALIKDGKPMLVVVGADWCPACQTLKNNTLAQMERQGKLREVSYVALNSDHHPQLASKIGTGGMIPQVIMYEKNGEGFRRRQLTGAQSEGVLQSLVQGAVQRRASLSGKLFRNASN